MGYFLDEEVVKYEESEEGSDCEGSEDGTDEDNEEVCEGEEEDGQDERCEASGRFEWGKTFVPRPPIEEHQEDEGEENEQGNENGEVERCEASKNFKWGKMLAPCPISKEHEEDEKYDGDHKLLKFRTYTKEAVKYEGSEEGSDYEGSDEDEGSEDDGRSEECSYEDEGSEDYGRSEECSYEDVGSDDYGRSEECSYEDEGSEDYGQSEEDSEECSNEDEEGSEECSEQVRGDEGEGSEEDGEDERCGAFPPCFIRRKRFVVRPICFKCFKWGKTFVPRRVRADHEEDTDGKGVKYEGVEGSEEDSSDEDEGSEEVSEADEDEEDGENERCEASPPPQFKNGKRFIPDEGGEEDERGSEDEGGEEDERGNEDGKEDEDGEDEIVERLEDEESDISDSEINEYKEAVHKLLKFRTYKIKGPSGQLRCPFCVDMENQEYNRLLEHAVRIAEGSTESTKQRANHFAMAKYLVIDLANYVERLPLSANRMLCNLTRELDLRKENVDQLQSNYEEKTVAIHRILEKRDETQHTFFEEARNMLCIARDLSKRVLEQQEMLNFDFENKRQRLNSWREELNKREASLTEEKRKMDDLVREKNDQMDDLMREKNHHDFLHHHHLAKECQPNDELLEAGKELMKGLEDMPSHCRVKIGVKRRGGEIDEKAFMSACKKRYLPHEAEAKAVALRCFWDKKTRDLEWHPFQFVEDDKGVPQKVLNESDKLLRGLKDEWGDEIYSAVVAALEYNNNTELWNFEEDRKASHCEVIRYIFSHWKTLQCRRDEIDEMIKTLF